MLSNVILRGAAAFGGAPFRFKKCTALGSAGSGAAAGSAIGGVPGALVGGALGLAGSIFGGLLGKRNTDKNQ
jgi:outer membrane lipoprotein SlyB